MDCGTDWGVGLGSWCRPRGCGQCPRGSGFSGQAGAMHRWDRRLRPPPLGVPPVRWRDADGEPSRNQLRNRQWRRCSQGCYEPVHVAITPEQRIAEAAALLPGYGAVGGWASAYQQGVRFLDGYRRPVLLQLGPDGKIRRRAGIELARERLPESDVVLRGDIPFTAPPRTAFDGARTRRGLVEAVVHLDMMLAAEAVDEDELSAYWAARPGWARVRQARTALDLADGRSASPPETRMRLVWMLDAGLPRPLVNPPVFDLEGNLLGFPDTLDPESGTALEYDSDDHRELAYHTDDNGREEWFEEHGLIVCRVTRLNLSRTRDTLVVRMQRARLRGLARDRRRDRWTLEPPPGWHDWR